jgi:hypothetical protein
LVACHEQHIALLIFVDSSVGNLRVEVWDFPL